MARNPVSGQKDASRKESVINVPPESPDPTSETALTSTLAAVDKTQWSLSHPIALSARTDQRLHTGGSLLRRPIHVPWVRGMALAQRFAATTSAMVARTS